MNLITESASPTARSSPLPIFPIGISVTDSLPDKAIDLVDEAASRLAMEKESVPEPIDRVQRRLRQLELAQRQLSDEQEASAVAKRTELEDEMKLLTEELANLREQWDAEKLGLDDAQSIRQEAEQLEHRFATLDTEAKQKQLRGESPEGVYQEMLTVKARQAELQSRLDEFEQRESASSNEAVVNDHEDTTTEERRRLLRRDVTEDEIAEVVSAWTGVPVNSDDGIGTCEVVGDGGAIAPASDRTE